jgi:uncharacterized protein
MPVREGYPEEYLSCIQDLIRHPLVRSMDQYISHSRVTCLDHSLAVSYYSYRACRYFGLDGRPAARAGLLHDLYLYDWHISHPYPGLHGLTHAQTALRNARANFELNEAETDSIARHMWPLTLVPPRFRIAWLVCLTDKFCALAEVFRVSRWEHLRDLKNPAE